VSQGRSGGGGERREERPTQHTHTHTPLPSPRSRLRPKPTPMGAKPQSAKSGRGAKAKDQRSAAYLLFSLLFKFKGPWALGLGPWAAPVSPSLVYCNSIAGGRFQAPPPPLPPNANHRDAISLGARCLGGGLLRTARRPGAPEPGRPRTPDRRCPQIFSCAGVRCYGRYKTQRHVYLPLVLPAW
jgi:hypothetical protein